MAMTSVSAFLEDLYPSESTNVDVQISVMRRGWYNATRRNSSKAARGAEKAAIRVNFLGGRDVREQKRSIVILDFRAV